MRAFSMLWGVCFMAVLAVAGGMRVCSLGPPHCGIASASELAGSGGLTTGLPAIKRVTMTYNQAACQTGVANCNCGGHCCICTAAGGGPLFGSGNWYSTTTAQTCMGFTMFTFCTGGVCSGQTSFNPGSCGYTWDNYVDP